MDAAIPVDAKNAPTGIWKTAQNAVPTAPTPVILLYEGERKTETKNLNQPVHRFGSGPVAEARRISQAF